MNQYIIPKTNQTKLKFFKFFSLFDIAIIALGVLIAGGLYLAISTIWLKWTIFILFLLFPLFLIVPLPSPSNQSQKIYHFIFKYLKFKSSYQKFIYIRDYSEINKSLNSALLKQTSLTEQLTTANQQIFKLQSLLKKSNSLLPSCKKTSSKSFSSPSPSSYRFSKKCFQKILFFIFPFLPILISLLIFLF